MIGQSSGAMSESQQVIECPVAVHRWFRRGEGWAYHPVMEPRLDKLMLILKSRLDSRATLAVESAERFSLPWSQGALVGCQVRDSNCPDPQAQNRHPTILRVALVPRDVKPEARDAVLAKLSALDAAEPGENSCLKLFVNAGELISNKTRQPSVGSWTKWGLVMALSGIIVCGVWLFGQGHIGEYLCSGEIDKKAQEAATSEMGRLLDKWQVTMPEKQRDATAIRSRFFTFLSLEEIRLPIEGQHPDKEFLRQRLRKKAPKDVPDTLRGLHRELKMVAARTDTPDSADEGRSLADLQRDLDGLFKRIEARMDYRTWLKEWDSNRPLGVSPWEEESPTELRRFIYHFVPRTDKRCLSREDAIAIVRQLRGWKIRGVDEDDGETRPWFVAHCYMTLLSHSGLDATLEQDNSWHAAFAKRLPRRPPGAEGFVLIDCDDEGALVEKGLRPLAEALKVKQSTEVVSLVNSIARGLKYKEWLQGCEQRRADAVRETDEEFQKSGYDKATRSEEVPPFGQVEIELVKGRKPTYSMTHMNEESRNKQVNEFVARLQYEPVEKDAPARK